MTRWEKLNCEMDTLAKAVLAYREGEQPTWIVGEPWWILICGKKIIKNQTDVLYKHIHKEEVTQYWERKKHWT